MKHRFAGLAAIAGVMIGLMSAAFAQDAKPDFKVTLLGTGTPPPLMNRFGPATLVQVGGKTILFDAGRVFTETAPRMAAFTHVVALTNGKIPPVGAEEIMQRTRTTYDGPLTMGQDLMAFVIRADGVETVPHMK